MVSGVKVYSGPATLEVSKGKARTRETGISNKPSTRVGQVGMQEEGKEKAKDGSLLPGGGTAMADRPHQGAQGALFPGKAPDGGCFNGQRGEA